MNEECEHDDFVRTHRRNTDPQGSTNGARHIKPKASGLSMLILDVIVSRYPQPTSYDDICRLNGWNPLNGYWKRVSDLKYDHFGQPCIVEMGLRTNRNNIETGVYQATEYGLALHGQVFGDK